MKTIETAQEYNDLKRKLNENQEAARNWMKKNRTNGIPSEVCAQFPHAKEINNDVRSAIEEFEFRTTPPDKYFLYINEKERTATTWTGQKLGTVQFGRPFKTNFGDIRQPIHVNATNGKRYHGTYFKSAGSYARITKFR